MTFQSDLTKAELYLQIDEANASLTALERSTRYQRRRYFAEINNSGNSSGAFEAFQELGVAPGAIDETTYGSKGLRQNIKVRSLSRSLPPFFA